jgi:hypothetical protein
MYRFLGDEIRRDSNDPSQPNFPYVFVESSGRQIKLRPGALDRDIQLLVKDGDTVVLGQSLFNTLRDGSVVLADPLRARAGLQEVAQRAIGASSGAFCARAYASAQLLQQKLLPSRLTIVEWSTMSVSQ